MQQLLAEREAVRISLSLSLRQQCQGMHDGRHLILRLHPEPSYTYGSQQSPCGARACVHSCHLTHVHCPQVILFISCSPDAQAARPQRG